MAEVGYCDTIGIDLGTTRSSVAVWDGAKVHVIANESGENTTPSWVTYLGTDSRRVGKVRGGRERASERERERERESESERARARERERESE